MNIKMNQEQNHNTIEIKEEIKQGSEQEINNIYENKNKITMRKKK